MVRARKNMASVKIEDNYFLIGGDVSFGYTRVRFATRFLGGIWLNSNAKTSKLRSKVGEIVTYYLFIVDEVVTYLHLQKHSEMPFRNMFALP